MSSGHLEECVKITTSGFSEEQLLNLLHNHAGERGQDTQSSRRTSNMAMIFFA